MSPHKAEFDALPQNDFVLRGIFYGVLAYFCFTAMQAAAKYLAQHYSVIEISFYRNLIGIVPLVIYMRMKNYKIFEKTGKPHLLLLRVLLGSTGLIVTFGAVKYLPMADATVIFFTGILFIPVMAFFILKEPIGPHRCAAILIGLCGVILMLHPTGSGQMLGVALAFTAALMQASTSIILRYLRTEPVLSITFYFILGGLIVSGLLMPFVAKIPTPDSWGIFLFIGVAGAVGQYCITSAFRMAPASVIAPFGYTGLIWATCFDAFIWGVVPGKNVYVGGIIILMASLYIGHRERCAAKRAIL